MFSFPVNASSTLKTVFCILLSLIGISCASLDKALEAEPDFLREVDLLLLTSPKVNPNIEGRASPIRVDIFQLTDDTEFMYTDYTDLIDNGPALEEENIDNLSLKETILEHSQFMLYPDDIRSLPFTLNEKAKYIGVIAGYRVIDSSEWKIVLLKQPMYWGGEKNYLYLKFNAIQMQQLSPEQMDYELQIYAARHPEDNRITKKGHVKDSKLDYSKGLFATESVGQ